MVEGGGGGGVLEMDLTISDLIFCNLAFLLNIESTDEEVPFALPSSGSRDAHLSGRWRRITLDAGDSNKFFPYLLHHDAANVSSDVAVVVQWSLNLVK